MTKYIDLTKPKEITMKIGNDVIVIPELSYAEYNQVYDYEHNEKTTRKDEAIAILQAKCLQKKT